ncbi:MAG: hypothetical protein NT016_00980, partial [Candidatus Aenigmarchaeota archaeon]|nr:hypothetical protein [Candidatus Aenigmarchaeota archaeon]
MAVIEKIQDVVQTFYNIQSELSNLSLCMLQNSPDVKSFEDNKYATAAGTIMDKIAYDLIPLKNASPYSKINPKRIENLYHVLKTNVVQFVDGMKNSADWGDAHWRTNFYKDGKKEELDALVTHLYDTLHGDRLKKFTTEEIPETLHYFAQLEHAGKLVEEKAAPKKKKAGTAMGPNQPPMQTAGTVVAAIAVIALAFTVLRGLNNLGMDTFGGALPGAGTGFFLLPGGPFVTSLQMVLFMLV